MVTWTKQKNGHVLTIKMDDEAIIKVLKERAEDFKQAIDDGEGDDIRMTSLFYCGEVGNYDNYLPPEECLTDIENMIDTIGKLCAEGNADVIFDMAQYKKNGTFKRSTRPVIRQLRFGWYDDDSYGWKTHCLRINPTDDFTAEIEYVHTVEHY